MPTRINTIACSLLLLWGAALLAASGARAETEDPRAASERRWVPSIAFIGGTGIQNQNAAVTSSCASGGQAREDVPRTAPPGNAIDMPACSLAPFGGPGNLRPPQAEDQDVLAPMVGAQLQIATPTLEFLPLRPRIFAAGELLTFYSADEKIAREGDPSGARAPENIPVLSNFPSIALGGLGSQTASRFELLGYGAKLGVAFPFEIFGRRLWIKPSAGWIQYEMEVEGFLVHAWKDDLTPPPPDPMTPLIQPQYGAFLREVTLLGSGGATLQGIGPGGELEMEAGRFGPLGVNVFLEASAYRIAPRIFGSRLGDDRKVEFTAQSSLPLQFNRLTPPVSAFGPDSYQATWSWEADRWLWRTGMGIRIQWLGY